MNILQALRDPNLLRHAFADLSRHRRWLVWLASIDALPLSELEPFGITPHEAMDIYTHHTRRSRWPTSPAVEAWALPGRRAMKTATAALKAVELSTLRRYDDYLGPGERATLMLLASDKRQARQAFRYVEGLVDNTPMLARMVQRRTRETIDFDNRVSLEVHVSSYRSVRGYALCGIVADEIAFWRDDSSSNPDVEVLNALRPAMAGIPGAQLIATTTPYSRRGAAWTAFRDHFGVDGDDIHVWTGTTREMNPAIRERVVARALEADPEAAAAEYLGQFRSDLEAFVSREAVAAVVVPDRFELPPAPGVTHFGFCDPSGGSADSMTLCISHREGERAVVDLVREVTSPFSPESVCETFVKDLRRYSLAEVVGDRYGASWVAERFEKLGVRYKPSELAKSDLYKELLPIINSGRVELLDHKRTIAQLCSLERRTARGGRDSIDHAPRQRDDLINSVAGAVHLALRKSRVTWGDLYGADKGVDEEGRGWTRVAGERLGIIN